MAWGCESEVQRIWSNQIAEVAGRVKRREYRHSLSIQFRSESVLGSISRLRRKQSRCCGNGEGTHIHTGTKVARTLQKTTSVQRKVLKWFYLIKQIMCIKKRKYRKKDTEKVTYVQYLAQNFGLHAWDSLVGIATMGSTTEGSEFKSR